MGINRAALAHVKHSSPYCATAVAFDIKAAVFAEFNARGKVHRVRNGVYRALTRYFARAKPAYASRAAGYVHFLKRELRPVLKAYHAVRIAGYCVPAAFYCYMPARGAEGEHSVLHIYRARKHGPFTAGFKKGSKIGRAGYARAAFHVANVYMRLLCFFAAARRKRRRKQRQQRKKQSFHIPPLHTDAILFILPYMGRD